MPAVALPCPGPLQACARWCRAAWCPTARPPRLLRSCVSTRRGWTRCRWGSCLATTPTTRLRWAGHGVGGRGGQDDTCMGLHPPCPHTPQLSPSPSLLLHTTPAHAPQVMHAYIDAEQYSGLSLDDALRQLLKGFRRARVPLPTPTPRGRRSIGSPGLLPTRCPRVCPRPVPSSPLPTLQAAG